MFRRSQNDRAAVFERELHRDYDRLQRRAARESRLAAAHPGRYRLKVAAFAGLGLAYLAATFGLLTLLLLVIGLALAMTEIPWVGYAYTLAVIAIVGTAMAKTLRLPRTDPPGLPLRPDDAPGLFEELDRLRTQLATEPIDLVVLDPEANAYVIQHPRFLGLGRCHNTLVVGLPLLLALDPEEARAILAHELAHLGGYHGRFMARARRVELVWERLGQDATQIRGAGLFREFRNWYFPRLGALLFAMKRQHEFEADAAAARVVGPALIPALLHVSFLDALIDDLLWRPVRERARETPEPSARLFTELAEALRTPLDPAWVADRVTRARARVTDPDDTHPSLEERLTALGFQGEVDADGLARPKAIDAATSYFGPNLHRISLRMSEWLRGRIANECGEMHQAYGRAIRRRDVLRAQAATRPLTVDEDLELADLTLRTESEETAIRAHREVVARHPSVARAHFQLGRLLLQAEDPEGEAVLRRAVEMDPGYRVEALRWLWSHHDRRSDLDGREAVRREFIRAQAEDRLAMTELSQLSPRNPCLPPDLDEHDLARVRAQLEARPEVSRAYVVRVPLPSDPQHPRRVLWVFLDIAGLVSSDQIAQRAERFHAEFLAPFPLVIHTLVRHRRWRRKLDRTPGALVYDAKASQSERSAPSVAGSV
jgi:Zn-dependent protease with chaperone function